MRANANLFWILGVFFWAADRLLRLVELIDRRRRPGQVEWVGTSSAWRSRAILVVLPRLLPRPHAPRPGRRAPAGHRDRRHRRRRPGDRALQPVELVAVRARAAASRSCSWVSRSASGSRSSADRSCSSRSSAGTTSTTATTSRADEIREARAGDEEGLFALVAAARPRVPGGPRGLRPHHRLATSPGRSPASSCSSSTTAKRLRGYALTTIVPLLSTNGPSAQLQEIVVDAGCPWTRLRHAARARRRG